VSPGPSPLSAFSAPTRRWFEAAFPGPTPVQADGWAAISSGAHALLLAPTGSGKTLAAFLWALDQLATRPGDGQVRVLYLSPLKALAADVERNLRAPLAGIRRAAEALGLPAPELRVGVRTGDTPARERAAMLRRPPDILVTTPESLFLMLTGQARERLRGVDAVIIDEIHAVAGTKRGAHLALSLERLSALCARDPQRIGLSATQRPLSEVAAFLGGDRPVRVVDASAPPRLDLEVVVPMDDLDHPPAVDEPRLREATAEVSPFSTPGMDRSGVWPVLQARVLDLVERHRSTLVFTNSRRLCERLAQRLNELALARGRPGPICRAHHGSVSPRQRHEIEEQLKAGQLPCIIATSSLELGIDMGAVDLVVQIASPRAVAAGLQRVGRAGHHVGGLPKARIFPKYKGDLLEAAAVAAGMRAGDIEPTRVPRCPLDVLAQQIVAMCVVEPWGVDELLRTIQRARPYAELSLDLLRAVLEMLTGRLPGAGGGDDRAVEELRPRLTWDRVADRLEARRDARLVVLANAGVIPDRGTFPVFLDPAGPRLGELDEEMVLESRKGDVFLLGASSWRITELRPDRVLVAPAPGEPGRMPFWRGEGPGRPVALGRAMGALVREVAGADPAAARRLLADRCGLDPLAASNFIDHVEDQRAATGAVPTDCCLVVERFRDELGDWRLCLHSPFGARVHAPWALAIEARLRARLGALQPAVVTDDGIVLRIAEEASPPTLDELLPDPDEIEELVLAELQHSALYGARFREAAARALLLPRRRPGERRPLWAQRLRSQGLLAATRELPTFPIALEAVRECLQDVFDLPALVEILAGVRRRELRVVEVQAEQPSPFARSLAFAFASTFLYEGDAPLAERRAAALSLDRGLLRELLGDDDLQDLLDPATLEAVEAELQGTDPAHRARTADQLGDLLRRVGDLSEREIGARVAEGIDPAGLIADLRGRAQIAALRIGGEQRWVRIEDVARYRDALGAAPPPGLPAALLGPEPDALLALLRRYARTHTPFSVEGPADRYGLTPSQALVALRALEDPGPLLPGRYRGAAAGWCDREVLRRVKRRALARLRGEVEPVDAAVFAAFSCGWAGLPPEGGGRPERTLSDAIRALEGCPLPWSEIEARILPARVAGFHARQLDELGARGELVWVGAGALGPRDGRVRLIRREALQHWLPPAGPGSVPDAVADDPLQVAILDLLDRRGACFTAELQRQLGGAGKAGAEALEAGLWSLVWSGQVTNDTFAPLRALGAPRRGPAGGGRWWRLDRGADEPAPPERAALHRALAVVERHGVWSPGAAEVEALPGGVPGLLPALRALEEAGKLRRGWFVAGLGGAQVAAPGAADRLRAARGARGIWVISAVDPANPYGASLPWPAAAGEATPRREAGAVIVLLDGRPAIWLGRGGRSLVAWPDPEVEGAIRAGADALRARAQREGWTPPRVQRVNGVAADQSPFAAELREGGFRPDQGALRLELRP
jgi:ATP-dependent Lhr-like helicase